MAIATKKIRKVLIANRGEIALRVIKTCKKLGIGTVAVYSEADRLALHVREADEAFLIGGAASADSYLRGDRIIEAALKSGADAIHPGYGFLSENANFTREVYKNNLIFIGPSPEAMEMMGDKISSKIAVEKYGVPMVPGLKDEIKDVDAARKTAASIGYPILIKASAGGGGKGMRIVKSDAEFVSQMELAVSEAVSSFGNGAVFIEKFVDNPRHIEIQILSDNHGNHVYLFERECSIQRRHQKLVEEAPSVILDEKLRAEMGAAAIDVARACNYSGAGTVEFLMDDKKNFYFLEMNTRLQVEHPVTELITGLDLVEQQLKVAQNEQLQFKQEDLSINGHAIELRLCAEDPKNDFLPSIGVLDRYAKPNFDFVRVDDCVEENYEIPIYYDNMFAKLIVWGKDRSSAIKNMIKAINGFKIEGIKSTLDFGKFVMQHPRFIDGDFNTHFISLYFDGERMVDMNRNEEKAAAILAVWLRENAHSLVMPDSKRDSTWFRHRKDL
jgi:acetyl-CoA carboxylase, biotin carboxylase subunit